ncbi:peptidoglycan editing factor PgeF [Fundicoccus culcitae]|uniref:Purine nucleoside phosphorylase n=1 Tax=Fundicoccus culcitae TaxID=2969821 RepID=A0ABY5P1Z9_9LACT|nr:peptidoglycan editing factor PgeF [Fundicoccus culcitae]UUX32727.1 peptidoglycan editing factor PgeF [Fundicoccus culcitae]
MNSKLLSDHGLLNYIAGADYNFRYTLIGDQIKPEIERAVTQLKAPVKEIYTVAQTHSANVAYANGENGEPFVIGKTFADADGLITDKAGVALLIKYADCTPVVIFDPVRKVQAIVHAGWRGTVQRISQLAIEQMIHDFDCTLENLYVYVGPTIDQDHYEVGLDVYEAFSTFPNRDQLFYPKGNKYHLSMQKANHQLILEAGIDPSHIEVEAASTFTDARFHSARQSGANYHLNGLVTMIPSAEVNHG